MRYIYEQFDDGSWGCLELDLMGYTDIDELFEDMKIIIKSKRPSVKENG